MGISTMKAAVLLHDRADDADIDDLLAECNDTDLRGHDIICFRMCVSRECDAGGESAGEIATDLETGKQIIEAARVIIANRRRELGVPRD